MFYDASAHQTAYAFRHGSNLHVVTYADVNLCLPDGGEPKIYRTSIMAYGFGVNADGSRFAVGSMIASGSLIDSASLKAEKITGAEPNPGFPEYYKAMVFDAAGNLYGITGDLRIFRVNDQNKMYLILPVM